MEFQDQSIVQNSTPQSSVNQHVDQPASTVEWTYLEPAQPTYVVNQQNTRIGEVVSLPDNQG